MKKLEKKEFFVIGLGRFGYSVVQTLIKEGRTVSVIDIDAKKVDKVKDDVKYAAICDSTDVEILKENGVMNADHIIVAMGDDVEACLMTVAALKEIGVSNITVKANSDKMAKILKALGVEDIVMPEKDFGKYTALRVMHSLIKDFSIIDEHLSMVQIDIQNEELLGIPLSTLNLREKFNINIVAIKRDNISFIPKAEDILRQDDIIVVIGANEDITNFEISAK